MESTLRRERLAGIILCVAGFILPTLVIYAALATAPLLIVIALAMLALIGRPCMAMLRPLRPLIVLLAILGLWGLLSTLWSIFPAHSVVEALRFLGISALGLIVLAAAMCMPPAERRLIGRGLVIGVLIALVLLVIERIAWAPIMRFFHPLPATSLGDVALVFYRFDRGLVVLVLMLWAALFAAIPAWMRLVILLATVAIVTHMVTEAAILALFCGIAVFAVARFFPRSIAALILAGTVAISAAVPLATPSFAEVARLFREDPWIKWSGIHRLLIWRFASDRAAEHPILGWGMDASRAMPGGNTDLTTLLPPANYPAHALALPLHPHNGALQLLLELGIPGLLLGLAIVAWIVVQVAWRAPLTPAQRAGALALIAASITIGLLSYGIWQEWWQATLWLAASLFTVTQEVPWPEKHEI
jgi:O-antigen ligase